MSRALALALALGPLSSSSTSADARLERETQVAQDIARAMRAHLLIPASVEAGRPRAWAYCRRAPGGCLARLEAFARMMVDACRVNGCDAWTLAAQAMRESRANPAAEGPGGERGILQIHPARREVRELESLRAWYRDDRYRDACLEERVDACQASIVWTAAEIMGRSLSKCERRGVEDVEACALSYYNTGRPDSEAGSTYARAVRRWRRKLEGVDA